jgi:predicted enzyme related to lactoylglutathione lyase
MRQGNFSWYQLLTTDLNAAEAFYGPVVGWKFRKDPAMPMPYSFIEADGCRIGGVMPLDGSSAAGESPQWRGSIAVDDVDEATPRAQALGGKVHYGPLDIPGRHGRLSLLSDPFGAIFSIASNVGEPGRAQGAHRPGVPGFGGWHELFSDDPDAAFEFYAGLFGWTRDAAHDMCEMGVYQIFAIDGVQAGGLFKRPPQIPGNCWNYYFNVESIGAASERLRQAGGKEMFPPMQVPGGSWIVMALDPQGAMFSLTSLQK